jgi:hypothetical protein
VLYSGAKVGEKSYKHQKQAKNAPKEVLFRFVRRFGARLVGLLYS